MLSGATAAQRTVAAALAARRGRRVGNGHVEDERWVVWLVADRAGGCVREDGGAIGRRAVALGLGLGVGLGLGLGLGLRFGFGLGRLSAIQ